MEVKNKLSYDEALQLQREATMQTIVHKESHYRYGQALFNLLHEQYKKLAEEIRGTDLDMFYKSDDIANTILFGKLTEGLG